MVIPQGVTSITNDAFLGCSNIENITLPEGIITIGNNAFAGCKKLASITIPNGVTTIGYNAFKGCKKLAKVTLPKSLTLVGSDAFTQTLWLNNLRKTNPIVVVNGMLLDGRKCTGNVVIPKGVTSIQPEAFYMCPKLEKKSFQRMLQSLKKKRLRNIII